MGNVNKKAVIPHATTFDIVLKITLVAYSCECIVKVCDFYKYSICYPFITVVLNKVTLISYAQ